MIRRNRIVRSLAVNLIVALVACAGAASPVLAQAVDDRFTFQGELRTPSGLATGSYDFRFRLYDATIGGLQVGAQQLATAPLVDGKFAVTLQFAGAFAGQNRYIEIDAAPAGSGAWVTLTPRQLLSAAPHASWAITAGSATNAGNSTTFGGQLPAFYTNATNMNAGTLPSARLTGNYTAALSLTNVGNTYFGSGANLTGLNATNLGSGTISDARLSSNVALLNTAQSFTATKTFSSPAPMIINDTTAGGYGIELTNAGGTSVHVVNNAAGLIGYGYTADVDGTSFKYGMLLNITGASGTGYGGFVNNNTPSGRGYYASMTGTGQTYGVYVSNNSTTGYGGYFNNTATTGATYGLYCENNSADGYGLFALHDLTTGTGPAVYGRTDSTSAGAYAIHARVNSASSSSTSAALRAENLGQGYGLYATCSGEGAGVYATTIDGEAVYGVASPSTTTEAAYGGYFLGGNSDNSYGVRASVSGAGIGVYGYSTGGYGGYFDTGVSGEPALYVVGTTSTGVITIRGGADLAENFEVATNPEEVTAGMVVMIDPDHEGKVKLASGAYNKCVAGVISGANELKAGMILGDFDGQKDGKPLALSGRVYTYVDATSQAVEPGDLLTTSDTPGYAMVATDASRSHGAVIGKAMGKLAKGEKGMVLVLVNLQ